MKQSKPRQGLSLERFAHAKTTSYDKKKAKEKEFALNAKKVNKYRKLKQRLAKEGKLVPLAGPITQGDGDEEEHVRKAPRSNVRSSPHSRPQGDVELDRIRARAGPVPDEHDETNESDMIGEESDEDVPPAASHRQSLEQTAERQGGLSRPKQSGSNEAKIHKGKGEQPAEAAAGSAREQQNPIRQQNLPVHSQERLHSPAGASAAAASGNAHVVAASSDGVEGTAGKKLPHGKPHRSRPPSRMQRIAAEVQARKDAEARAKDSRRADIDAHKAKVAEVEKQRKQQTKLLRKRTRHGQPVMRYRMDKLLGQLQAEAQHG